MILSAAAGRADGNVLPLPDTLRLNKGAETIVIQSLIRKGFVAEVIASLDDEVWRIRGDGERLTLIITDQGLVALGIEPGEEEDHSGDGDADDRALHHTASGTNHRDGPSITSSTGINARQQSLAGHTSPGGERTSPPEQTGCSDPKVSSSISAASPPCVPPPSNRDKTSPDTPKAGSKKALLLDLLGQTSGVPMAAMIHTTGWQAHSVRAALSGLRKQGHTITRSRTEGGQSIYQLVEGASG